MALLHIALLSALLAQRYRPPQRHADRELEAVQWLLPLAKPAAGKPAPTQDKEEPRQAARPLSAPARAQALPRPALAAKDAIPAAEPMPAPAAPSPASPAVSATVSPPNSPPAATDPFDLSATRPAPSAGALLRRDDWGAGKADHDLRGGKLAKLVRPTDTLQAGLERAFREAGEAVPPKWFSAPEIREMPVPDGRTRMYKIRTAIGTYCFYKPDPSLQAGYDYKLMTCPREK